MEEKRMHKRFGMGSLKGKDHWKELDVDGRIILKWFL
jgi:hypothetical protein